MNFLLPQPDSLGIVRTKELYLRKFKKELSDSDAQQILAKIMRHLFLINNPICSSTDNTPENPMTISQ